MPGGAPSCIGQIGEGPAELSTAGLSIALSDENLSDIDEALIIIDNADADFCPLAAKNIAAMAGAAHESSLGFFHRSMMGDILSGAPEGITKML